MDRREMITGLAAVLGLGGLVVAEESLVDPGPKAGVSDRRRVIPNIVISTFELKPASVGTFGVLGEDGNFYALDDALWALFQLLIGSVQHIAATKEIEKRELMMRGQSTPANQSKANRPTSTADTSQRPPQ